MSRADVLPAVDLGQYEYGGGGSTWERDRQAFWQMRDSLLSEYLGKYVAVHQRGVVDSDTDELALARRLYKRYGYVPVYVQLVTDSPLPARRVPSPRVREA